jgi:hypothetical protein
MKKAKIKTQIEIDRQVWAAVRAYATGSGRTINVAVEHLIAEALAKKQNLVASQSGPSTEVGIW